MCCDASEGCGVLSPNWMQEAEYEGLESFENRAALKWTIEGNQANYYYESFNSDPMQRVPFEQIHMWSNDQAL